MQIPASRPRTVLLLAILLLPLPCQAQSDTTPLRIVGARTPRPDNLELLLELPTGVAKVEAREVQLLEDAQPTAPASSVQPFRNAGWTFAAVLAIDTSGSVKQYLTPVATVLPKFVKALPPKDALALITFDDAVHEPAPFGTPRDRLEAQLAALKASGRRTLLYNALDRSLTVLEGLPADRTRRRIVVVSDGADESTDNPAAADMIIQRAIRSRAAIDTIWVGRPVASTRNTLVRMAERTGGIHSDATNPARVGADVEAALGRVASVLGNSVVASFTREVQTTAATREIGVGLPTRGIAPAVIALQVPRSAPPAPAPDSLGAITLRWLLRLLVSTLAVYVPYVFVYLRVRRKNPHPNLPAPLPMWLISKLDPQPILIDIPPDTTQKPAKTPSRRHTMVAAPEPPVPAAGQEHGLAIEAITGPMKGQRISIAGPRFQVGAANDNDLRITDKYISGTHARFEQSQGRWVLFDQGSSNGTFVDGGRLTTGHAHVLRDGQVIRMGSSEFRVRLATPEGAAPGPKPAPTEVVR